MARLKTRVPKQHGQRIVYIDPMNSGSTVGYRIETTKYNRLLCLIDLTDCNKRITWELNTRDTGRSAEKLDLAISMLIEARDLYNAALKQVKQRRRRRITK
ncbi:MAG: hypothetical protein ACHQ9S_19000 [Candidatus Binatia bacterium]